MDGGNNLEIHYAFESLREKRPIFHSEADFQFALAWEIQRLYPHADIRLEYPATGEPNKHIDIIVRSEGVVYPIELKYKTKQLSVMIGDEYYKLKEHGAQDVGAYDCIKDICRVESFVDNITGFRNGYVIWLTNDYYYWRNPSSPSVGYAEFSIHNGAIKKGVMQWGNTYNAGSIKGRESKLSLRSDYEIVWNEYSTLNTNNGIFKYALITVGTRDEMVNLQ